MTDESIGQVYALSAAVSWSIGLILFKKSGATIGPIALNLFKNTVAVLLLSLTLLFIPDCLQKLSAFSTKDLAILAISGVIGIAIADTIFFVGLSRIGVGLISIFDCLYSPSVVVFAFLLNRETMRTPQLFGGILIISAILVTVTRVKVSEQSPRNVVIGMICSMTAVTLMALGIVLAKPVIEKQDLIWSTALRLIPGTMLLTICGLALPHRKRIFGVFCPSSAWQFLIPGSIIGAYFCLLFWIAGFKFVSSGVAAFLNQTSVVFSILLAAIFLREPLTPRKILSVLLALVGVAIMQLGGHQP